MTVVAILGMTPPVPSDGYGGWTLITRPRRKDLTEWTGIRPLRVLVPIVLGVRRSSSGRIVDGLMTDTSAEADRITLERMSQPPSVGAEPPLISVYGPIPHANDGPWLIESFDWDPDPIYSPKGYMVRQQVTVHLLQYSRDDRLTDITAAQMARLEANITSASAARASGGLTNQPTQSKTYVVKQGDTLTKIAASRLGNYKRWTDIMAINPSIIDPDVITVGQVLRMP